MRVFFCIELPTQVKEQIAHISSMLKQVDTRVSWVRQENLHITLKFLGEVSSDQIKALKEIGRNAIRNTALNESVHLEFNKYGGFPNLNNPRVIWLGCHEEPKELQLLVQNLGSELKKIGIQTDQKRLTTHVTIGRIKDPNSNTEKLTNLMEKAESFEIPNEIDNMTLMKSELSPDGSIYTPIFQIPRSNR
jgi:2'-5' RNA ligase